jgi:hypothetical protein
MPFKNETRRKRASRSREIRMEKGVFGPAICCYAPAKKKSISYLLELDKIIAKVYTCQYERT